MDKIESIRTVKKHNVIAEDIPEDEYGYRLPPER